MFDGAVSGPEQMVLAISSDDESCFDGSHQRAQAQAAIVQGSLPVTIQRGDSTSMGAISVPKHGPLLFRKFTYDDSGW